MDGYPGAKKSLGQHFLNNASLCGKIARLLAPRQEDNILEIGPGPGALTRQLLLMPRKKLLLIEKDCWWARERAKDAETICGDALTFDWGSLSGEWKIIGNLPYNIASPLIWEILDKCDCWTRLVFMTQKEVAQRICAPASTKQYGALSVWIQAHARVKLELTVPPGAFSPPPKVDSAVTSFTPIKAPRQFDTALASILHICFQQRRKQIGGIFKRGAHTTLLEALESLAIDPKSRPENLTWQTYLSMAEFITPAAMAS